MAKDGVDDVDEEVDDEQMDEVFSGQGGGGDEVQRQRPYGRTYERGLCNSGLKQLAQLRWRPRLLRRQVLQAPPIHHSYGHMMLTNVSGVGVPLSRGLVLPKAATR